MTRRGVAAGLVILALLSACGEHPPSERLAEPRARAVALEAVPGGRVKSHELEKENGRWIYSYDLVVEGGPGTEEIHVDAVTGAVVAHEHESVAAERSEADQGSE